LYIEQRHHTFLHIFLPGLEWAAALLSAEQQSVKAWEGAAVLAILHLV
jgi:hypothetical protein